MFRFARIVVSVAVVSMLWPMAAWAQYDSELVGFNGPPIEDPATSQEMFRIPEWSGSTTNYVVHNVDSEAFLNPLVDFRHYFVLDGRLDWTGPAGWFAWLTGTNLLDRTYGEVPGVQMPGLLVTGTVGKRF